MNFVGIDVHKVHTQICIQDDSGKVLRETRIQTCRERLRATLAGGRMKVLLESSGESEWVARCIEELGHEVIVADPGYVLMYGTRSRRVKTDARDARALADACRLGAFRPAHRTSEPRMLVRRRLRVRDALVRSRAELVTLVQAILRQVGVHVPSGSPRGFAERVKGVGLSGEMMSIIAPLLAQLEPLNKQISYCDAVIERMAKRDPAASRLQTVPSVGAITASAFVALIDRADRFDSAAQVAAYVGLTPREMSSGEKRQQGRITKGGDSYVRALLVQAALRIMRTRPPAAMHLWTWAERVAARRGKFVARVALARRLSAVLFAMMRDTASFRPHAVAA